MTVREKTQEFEALTLSPRATLSAFTKGRDVFLEECPFRTCFQRDRDRILHSKSYRRLMHKTQVFLSPEGDHYRTRLTHTQEVSQIARTIARALRLNEDLTEAVSLGHDLGHTPFGHAGERALNEIHPGGFVHSRQSVRVVETLEMAGAGLNLTVEVRDGIRYHSSGPDAQTLEGRVVRVADKIAYLNHDFDDAVRAGVLGNSDLPEDVMRILGKTGSERITAMIASLVANSGETVAMDAPVENAFRQFREFMFGAVYLNPVVKGEETKAVDVVKKLYEYFVAHIDALPKEYYGILEREGAPRATCDYVSGMSDRYAVSTLENLFIPKSWGIS